MKALILAAGFGTRLLPHTKILPKPLFPVAGQPILDRIITALEQAGCEAVMVNTHHLAARIEGYIAARDYTMPVVTRHEPEILGTGGAIRNAADFWDARPFIVINSDIVTNIDLKAVYKFHLNHEHPVTLVLHDDPAFNTVGVAGCRLQVAGCKLQVTGCRLQVTGFNSQPATCNLQPAALTFTGIQVLDPVILDYIPDTGFFSSITAYESILADGKQIRAFVSDEYDWQDVGTPERFQDAVSKELVPQAFEKAGIAQEKNGFSAIMLKGDGSDRKWSRLSSGPHSLILADHGITPHNSVCECDAFVNIGNHLFEKGAAVPQIHLHDRFSGLVFTEDLGDIHLQSVVNKAVPEVVRDLYCMVIDALIRMSVKGYEGFDTAWTWQTPEYDREVILEKECRYFIEAFLAGYLNRPVDFEDYEDEFSQLADRAVSNGLNGFMHRDCQSRNIMIHEGRPYFIDFQGGRVGPFQYDLASLLIDPYVNLPVSFQEQMLDYALTQMSKTRHIEPEIFKSGYQYCALSRNLQILGAFAFLSQVKGKIFFRQYIPAAIRSLEQQAAGLPGGDFPKLKKLVSTFGIVPTLEHGNDSEGITG